MIFPQKHSGADTTIFSVMSALAAQHNAVNLSQGFPDYPIDERLQDYLSQATQQGFNQYAPMAGLPYLTSQIALQKSQQLQISIEASQVTVCPGASYGIFMALSAVLARGDEVIILEPAYDAYIPAIEINGGVPVAVSLQYPGFSVDWDQLKNAINAKTKAIIVNTPHNPTGVVWSEADWAQLSALVSSRDILVISDEVYDQIIFDALPHQSVLQQEALKGQCVAVFSFGKQMHATGWKIGYTIASESISKAIRKVHQFIAFSVNTPSQWAIAKFLECHPKNESSLMLAAKRDLMLDLIGQTPFKVLHKAKGSYFQMVDFENWKRDMSDTAFAEWLTKEIGVATIPLSAFYKDATDHHLVRLCFAKENQTLITAMNKIIAATM